MLSLLLIALVLQHFTRRLLFAIFRTVDAYILHEIDFLLK